MIFTDQDSWSWSQTLLWAIYKWLPLVYYHILCVHTIPTHIKSIDPMITDRKENLVNSKLISLYSNVPFTIQHFILRSAHRQRHTVYCWFSILFLCCVFRGFHGTCTCTKPTHTASGLHLCGWVNRGGPLDPPHTDKLIFIMISLWMQSLSKWFLFGWVSWRSHEALLVALMSLWYFYF